MSEDTTQIESMKTLHQRKSADIFDQYVILHKIISFMDPATLHAAEQVNHHWKEIVGRERERRSGGLFYETWMEVGEEENVNLSKRQRLQPCPIPFLENKFKEDIGFSKAALVLLFTSAPQPIGYSSTFGDMLAKTFSDDTILININAEEGIIGTDRDTKVVKEYQNVGKHPPSNAVACCLVLPQCDEFGVFISKDVTTPPPHTKLVLVFQGTGRRSGGFKPLSLKKSIKDSDADIWYLGGVGSQISMFNFKTKELVIPVNVCIGFHGRSLRVNQCVIDSGCVSQAAIEETLESLKTTAGTLVPDRCCAIVFTCCMRGINMLGQGNVEADIFQKVFPRVPLFGYFTGGELAVRCPYYQPVLSRLSNVQMIGFSSVFCLLAW